MAKGLKIFSGILLAVNIIFSANFALGADATKTKQIFSPMELSYPNIPGLGRFSDYQNLDPSLQIGFIISYIFKLVFFISIGAGLVALLVAGVLYIVSSSKPRFLILAKQMASNAMLGLFILICASLLLYVINPQLLSLTLQKPTLDTSILVADSSTPNTITLAQIPFTEKLTEAVDNLAEKVYVNDKGQYYEQLNVKDGLKWCLTDGYGGAVTKEGNSIAGLPVVEPPAVDPNKTIKESGCVGPDKKSTDKYIYKAEIQLRQTAEIVGKAAVILQDKVDSNGDVIKDASGNAIYPGLESLLAKCRCGEALKYVDWKVGNATKPECKAGLVNDGGAIYRAAVANGMCYTQCKSCGQDMKSISGKNAMVCDLRDVRKTKEGNYEACIVGNGVGTCNIEGNKDCWVLIPPNTGFIEIKEDNPCRKPGLNVETIDPSQLIKWKTLQILELQTELEAKSRLSGSFLDSVLLVARALDVNKIDFLISGAKDASFGYDTQAKIEQWTKEGKNVALLDYGSASENTQSPIPPVAPLVDSSQPKGFLAKIKAWLAPIEEKFKMGFSPFASAVDVVKIKLSLKAGTAYYVVNDTTGAMNSEVVAINAALFRDGERFNLFSVLTDLTLEDIEGVFKQCLVSAFGEADYKLNKEQIDSIVKSAMNSGSADHLKEVIKGVLDKMAQAIVDGAKDAVSEEANFQIITKYFNKCSNEGNSCSGGDDVIKKVAKELKEKNCGATLRDAMKNTCCYCIKNLVDNNISPRFVTDTITNLLTKDLGDVLPGVQKILHTQTLDVLFPPNQPDKHINKFLKGDTVDAYNAILNGALTKPFDKQIPSLGVLLNKPMEKVLPEFVSKINTGFINAVSSTKHYIKKYQEDYLKGLAEQFIEKPLSQWAENWFDRAGIGTKNLPIEGCFEKLRDGYLYKVTAADIAEYNLNVGKYWIEYAKDESSFNPNLIEPQQPGQCVKMTADQVNRLDTTSIDYQDVPKAFYYVEESDPENKGLARKIDVTKGEGVGLPRGVEPYKVDPLEVKTICETATYSWGASYSLKNSSDAGDLVPKRPEQTGDKTYACYGTNNGVSDIKGAIETVQDQEKLKTYLAGGLVNYAEKLGIALTQTAMQFALAYGRVYIEDHLVSRLIGEWNAITNFQEGMAKFMKSSVKDVLPNSISDALQSNIKESINDFCNKYKDAREKAYGTDLTEKATNSCASKDLKNPDEMWINVADMAVTIPGGFEVNDTPTIWSEDLCVSQKVGDKICQLEEHLDSTVLDEIKYLFCDTRYTDDESKWAGMCESFFASLRMPFEKALNQICIDGHCLDIGNWFNKSIAETLFPEVKNLKELVATSPKNLICGDVLALGSSSGIGGVYQFKDIKPKIGAEDSVAKKCQAVFKNKFALIPQVDQVQADKMGDLMPWCSFINYTCKTPILSLPCDKKTVGGFMKCVIDQGCNLLSNQISKRADQSCAGSCFCKNTCPSGNIAVETSCALEKNVCTTCSVLAKNSVFYSLLYKDILIYIGPVANRGDMKLKVEKEIYVQLYNAFPELKEDIQAVAFNRGIASADWNIMMSTIPDQKEIFETVTSGNLRNMLLLAIQIVKEPSSDRSLTPSIKNIFGKDEFLGATPYDLLATKVCPSIVASFEKDNHGKTLEDAERVCLSEKSNSGEYTMGSVEPCSLSKIISTVLTNASDSNAEGYVLCKILDKTPKQVFGLDQSLDNYIQPPEYRILFDLLRDQLSEGSQYDCRPKEKFYYENGQAMCCDSTMGIGRGACYKVGERPAELNQVLDFMSKKDPITALRGLQQSMPTPEAGIYFSVGVFNKSGDNCLKLNSSKISNCSSPVPQILEAMGIGITGETLFTKYPAINGDEIKVYADGVVGEIVWPKENILGFVVGTSEDGKPVAYYFVQPFPDNDFIIIYKKPDKTSTAKADFKNVLDFMETPIGTLLSRGIDPSNRVTILDLICVEITKDAITNYDGVWPVDKTICDIGINLNLGNFGIIKQRIIELLKKTPTELMETYITKPFSLPLPGTKNNSFMDFVSANTALGQPVLKTLFDTFGAEKPLKDIVDFTGKKAKLVDNSIMKGVEVGQDAINYALVDAPMKLINPIKDLIGGVIGGKKATEITGTGCYDMPSEGTCKSESDIVRTVTVNLVKKEQCCNAKADACTPRCRIVDPKTTQCNILLGEDPLPESNAGIFGDGTYRRCCFKLITNGALNQCQRCRAVNFDAQAKCRKADENGMGEEREDRDNNTCCSLESRESPLVAIKDEDITSKDKWIESGGSCCTTVSQCISNRLSSHLENLAEMMADGYVRLGSLKK